MLNRSAVLYSLILASTPVFAQSDLFPALVEKLEGNPKANIVPARTIEAFLVWLPRAYRANHTYVYKRAFARRPGIQEASFSNPRAIVFGADGKLVLTFNGAANQEGYYSIELARWRDDNQAVELREIRFAVDGKSNAQISSPNPAKCLGCHGEKPRHIWDSYNMWPGVYGGFDDAIIDDTDEGKQFAAFKKLAKSHDRYRTLFEALPGNSDVEPYYSEKRISDVYTRRAKPSADRRIGNMPNLRLNEFLIRINARRVYSTMKASPLFNQYKYLVAALLPLGCDTWGSWLSDARGEEWRAIVSSLTKDYARKFPQRYGEVSFESKYEIKARVLELLDVPFGTDWNLLFHSRVDAIPTISSDYSDGRASFISLVSNLLWDDLSLEEPKLIRFRSTNADYEKELFSLGLLTISHREVLDGLGKMLKLFPDDITKKIEANKEACTLIEAKLSPVLR